LEIATLKASVVTLKHGKTSSSKGFLVSRKAISGLTLAKSAAHLAYDKAKQEARLSSESVKGAHVAVDGAKEEMWLVNQRPEELRAVCEARGSGELQRHSHQVG